MRSFCKRFVKKLGQYSCALFFPLMTPSFAADFAQPRIPTYQKDYDLYVLEMLETDPSQGKNFMTGNWNGARTYLHQHGLEILPSYVTDMLGNVDGGNARGFAYTGSFALAANLDFDRALQTNTALSLYASTTWRTGTNLSSRKIGNQFNVSQLYGYQTVLLGELYLKKKFFNELLVLKGGRLTTGNDFLISPLYSLYLNDGIDNNPASIFFNFPALTVYPVATWGAYLALQPIPQMIFKAAAYNANTNILKNKFHGVNFTFSSTNGVIWITECDFLINQGEETGLWPGNYKMGFIYQTGNTAHFTKGTAHGNYNWYLLVDQVIYQSKQRTLTPFAAIVAGPEKRNPFPFFFAAGLVCEGLFASRPDDTTNFSVIYGKYSSYLPSQSAETVLELNHWFQINNWLTITPDIQYIIKPQGYSTIPNAFVIGFQTGFIL